MVAQDEYRKKPRIGHGWGKDSTAASIIVQGREVVFDYTTDGTVP
jgi:hypothetical protein